MNSPDETTVNRPMRAPETSQPTRPLYWTLRRELWEHRSVYLAPLAAAALLLLGFLFTLPHLPQTMRAAADLDPSEYTVMLAMPYTHAGWLLMATGILIGITYSLDALYSERRDRSILFWKSLPVSDLTTVLGKSMIPLVVLPAGAFLLTLALQLVMLLLSTLVLLLSGGGAASLWSTLPLLHMDLVLLYEWLVLILWLAPVYGWLLLVSGWARRTPFLWALLTPLAVCLLEHITLRTSYVWTLVKDRIGGFISHAFSVNLAEPVDVHLLPFSALTPGRFLSSPGLWLGLLAAAGLLVAATRQRRYREPI